MALDLGEFKESFEVASNAVSVADADERPRPAHKRRLHESVRGLPDDGELLTLATVYLQTQRELWPNLVKTGLLPEPADAMLLQMVQDFKRRHAGGPVDVINAAILRAVKTLGGAYSRFSCDNSSSNSIPDQLVQSLRFAQREGRFVPWNYVFADYAISGLHVGRRGYTSYKGVLKDPRHQIETTYVDDFTRASRDEIEWWKLASLCRRLGKRLRGASDGFDLSQDNWDVQIMLFNLLSRMFIKSLRQKVKRGMRGAARRGSPLGRMPLGHCLRRRRDANGNLVLDQDGLSVCEISIHKPTALWVARAFDLYANALWSESRIARLFNRHNVDGSKGWDASSMSDLLQREKYVDVFIFNRTSAERDPETGKTIVKQYPPEDWEITHMPHLRLINDELWCKALRRRQESRRNHPTTGKRQSRNEYSATTAVSALLFCGYCSTPDQPKEIVLYRSGKYQVMGCMHGTKGKHDCKLTSSKSVRIILDAITRFVRETLLTPAVSQKLVEDANRFLAEDAKKPQEDVAPIKKQENELQKKIKFFISRMMDVVPDVQEEYDREIISLKRQLNAVQQKRQQLESRNQLTPQPLTMELVAEHLKDLSSLLDQEPAAVSKALRDLLGPVMVMQKVDPRGRKTGAIWEASFTPRLLPFLAQRARELNYPDSLTLEFLTPRIWITPKKMTLDLESVPEYVRYAREIKHFIDAGRSLNEIAQATGKTWVLVNQAAEYLKHGRLLPIKHQKPKRKRADRQRCGEPAWIAHSDEVRQLKDQRLTYGKIAHQLNISRSTASRAYRHATRAEDGESLKTGKSIPVAKYFRIDMATRQEILRLRIEQQLSAAELARRFKCGESSVYRILAARVSP